MGNTSQVNTIASICKFINCNLKASH